MEGHITVDSIEKRVNSIEPTSPMKKENENLTNAIIKIIPSSSQLNQTDDLMTLKGLPCVYLSIPLCKHETDAPKQVIHMILLCALIHLYYYYYILI